MMIDKYCLHNYLITSLTVHKNDITFQKEVPLKHAYKNQITIKSIYIESNETSLILS